MTDQYIGEIRFFACPWAPVGWVRCDGSELSINNYTQLYSVISTIYGGDGRETFKVPDLRGRVPLHASGSDGNYRLGQLDGDKTITLNQDQMPQHTHTLEGTISRSAGTNEPENATFTISNGALVYESASGNLGALSGTSLSIVGGGKAHNNRSPYLVLNFYIAYQGAYPPH
ncbi:MAG: tail fiber protein [Chloroflexota bacterium]